MQNHNNQHTLFHCTAHHGSRAVETLFCTACTALFFMHCFTKLLHNITLHIIDDVLHCSTDHHLSCRPPICFRHRHQPLGQQDTLLHFNRHMGQIPQDGNFGQNVVQIAGTKKIVKRHSKIFSKVRQKGF